jgi:hypothetical protein
LNLPFMFIQIMGHYFVNWVKRRTFANFSNKFRISIILIT